jgi:hypothetical protein
MIINVYCSSRHPLFLSDFNEPCLILTYFGKILIYQFHENLSSGSEFFHAGRQTDRQAILRKCLKPTQKKKIRVKKEDMPRENRTYGSPFITNTG